MTNLELWDLCQQYRRGDVSAADALITQNEAWLKEIAKTYATRYRRLMLDEEDYKQEGRLALLRAAERYRPENGAFLAYAGVSVRHAILDAIRAVYPNVRLDSADIGTEAAASTVQSTGSSGVCSSFEPDPYKSDPERIFMRKELYRRLYTAMGHLPPRENIWVRERYGFADGAEHSLASLARRFHLTEGRAKGMEQDAIARMKREMREE